MSDALAQYQERIRKRDEEDLRSILKTVYGKRFITRLLSKCHIWEQPWVQDSPDATAFNCGQINVGNQLLKEVLEVRPEAYLEMTKTVKEEDDVRRNLAEAQAREAEEP